MRASLIRTAAGTSFTADIPPADVVDRCDQCRRVFREGDWFCADLAARRGYAIARFAAAGRMSGVGTPTRTALMPVFLSPRT